MKLLTIFLIVAVAAIVASASQASTRLPNNPQTRALMIYGNGLNQIYHLGKYGSASTDAQNRAIHLRSIALNRRYHLGAFAK